MRDGRGSRCKETEVSLLPPESPGRISRGPSTATVEASEIRMADPDSFGAAARKA